MSGCDIGTARRQSAAAGVCTPSTHQPPSSANPSAAGDSQQPARAIGQQFGGHLRGVHPDLQHRIAPKISARIGVRVGEPIGEAVAALLDHRERLEAMPDLGGRGGAVQVPGQRHHPPGGRRGGHRVQRVEQRGGGDVGGNPVADCGGQPRLGPAGFRRLGNHQQRHRNHEITFQKSRIAVTLPRSEPLTFDLPPVLGP